MVMLNLLYYVTMSLPLPLVFTIYGTLTVTVYIYIKSLTETKGARPRLYYKDSSMARYVIKHCRRLTSPFTPPPWMRNAHLQTCMPRLYTVDDVTFEREYLQMDDEGVVALDWAVSTHTPKKKSSILIVLPGLTSCAADMKFLCHRGIKKGFRPVVFNKRGHGDSYLTTPKLQSFGDPTDLRQAVEYIRCKFPSCRLVCCGVSAGSGLLVSYLGEYGSSCHLSAAVCISPGYDAEVLFGNPLTWPYDFLLLLGLKKLLSKHQPALADVIDTSKALKARTVGEFEEEVYAKIYGFTSMSEYWEKNNPMRDIDEVTPPIMCISSVDDPVCLASNIPYDLFAEASYPNLILAVTEHGGHTGFIENQTYEPWGDKLAIDFLSAVLHFLDRNDAQ